jgi:DNA-binding NarL/FixJ family response regulator
MEPGEHRTAVIVDQHPLWLDALEQLLRKIGVEVVGRTTEASEALSLVERHQPDVVVSEVDVDSELTLLTQARAARADVKCVVLSDSNDPALVESVFARGASVFCVKTAEPDDLASAIRQTFDNSVYFANSYRPPEPRQNAAPGAEASAGLTRRELEILQLVAEGHSNSQLARMLWVTEQTVKFHLSNIYRKLNVANRTEASPARCAGEGAGAPTVTRAPHVPRRGDRRAARSRYDFGGVARPR